MRLEKNLSTFLQIMLIGIEFLPAHTHAHPLSFIYNVGVFFFRRDRRSDSVLIAACSHEKAHGPIERDKKEFAG